MNISYNWLKKYINLDVKPEELSSILTSIGLEVGSVEEHQSVKGGMDGLVVGEVLTCVDHENSDHLHVTTVDVGEAEPLQIVCGAPNVAVGQKVVVATIGTKLYAGDDEFVIKKSKIRGVESFGMICAEDEIGLGENHQGIIVLPSNIGVGTLAKDYYDIQSDVIFEVDITPNRVDATSHYGVARDLAAYFSIRDKSIVLTKPSVDFFKVQNESLTIPVIIENTEACPRYAGVTISDVTVGESPVWLKNALIAIGQRPINNVVDATNFVLHELGQPLHAFDADKIKGKKIIVKTLAEGSEFVTLDAVERKLSGSDLMICNESEPMCIGGVFGGLESGVTNDSKNIFLECAYFNPVYIRKTARRHGLSTDASFRFERGCDPDNVIYVLKRCALLIQEIAGGTISSKIQDAYPNEIKPFEVSLSLNKIYSLIGKTIEIEKIDAILKSLEIKTVNKIDDTYHLLVPTYRVDVQRDVDVVEDVLRIYGYNNVETGQSLHSTLSHTQHPDTYKLQNIISEQLTAQGFNEILNNSLTKENYYTSLTTYPSVNCVKLINSLSSDLSVMRQTLLFGGLENICRNLNRKNGDLKFYELGNCYFYTPRAETNEDVLSQYGESYRLGIWLTGNKNIQSWAVTDAKTSVYELKAYIHNILLRLGIKIQKIKSEKFSNDLIIDGLDIISESGKKLGYLGVVRQSVCKTFDIEQDVFYSELDWNNLLGELTAYKTTFEELSKYPEVRRDLALLIDKKINFAEIEKIAYETERKLLKKVNLFDVYEGKNLEVGKKSYAVSFFLQDNTRTLTDKQIDDIMKRIQANIENKLGAKLR